MKLSLHILLLAGAMAVIFPGCNDHESQTGNPWPPVSSETKPWSRWWWLGSDVDRSNIEKLIQVYADAGIGGLEITPIYGVQGRESNYIDFLSPQWMEMLEASLNAAADHGLAIDMNLGTGWPFGGPQISPEAAAGKLILQHYRFSVPGDMPSLIVPEESLQRSLGASLEALMAWQEDGTEVELTSLVDSEGMLHWEPAPGNWQLCAAFSGKTGQQVKRAAPGGQGLTMDHFSAEALQQYLSRFDSVFHRTPGSKPPTEREDPGRAPPPVRCFFNDSYEVYGATWTTGFFDAFEAKRGYDLKNYLREFSGVMEPEGSELVARLKSDYRETMSELLLEQFTVPWTEWSHRIGSMTRNQAHGSPGNLIDLYGAVDIPECEIFGHRTFDIPGMRANDDDSRNVEPNPMMLKLATSAAHITNKPLISNETFTWLGEHFKVALSQCKPEVEQAFLAGINHVFFHGTPYSPEEAAWPGWLFYASVHFGPTNSWWPHLQEMNRYITRCQSVLQSGQAHNEVLAYWPIYDLWHDDEGSEMMLSVHNIEEWLVYPGIEKMALHGYSYDFISDALLNEVEAGEGSLHSANGKVQHRALVVPRCRFMPLPTLQKILTLAEAGAVVVFETLPQDVPGLHNLENRQQEFHRMVSSMKFSEAAAGIKEYRTGKGTILLCHEPGKALDYAGIEGEKITQFGLKFIRRTTGDAYFYYLVNHTAESIDAMVPLQYGGKEVVIMDPQDGSFGVAQTETGNGVTEVRIQLRPGRALFLKCCNPTSVNAEPWPYEEERFDPIPVHGNWKLTFKAGGPSLPHPVDLSSPVPWTSLDDPSMDEFSGTALYEVTFSFSPAAAEDYLLNLGKVFESARVRLNGSELDICWSIPFEARAGHLLTEGENTLEIEVANLMANRISAMDRARIPWRIFQEINFVNIDYQPFDASGWEIEPSGLAGPVVLIPVNYQLQE
jgi:hypothetical protein